MNGRDPPESVLEAGVVGDPDPNPKREAPFGCGTPNKRALRVNVGFGLLVLGWWTCFQESSVLVVGGVGESVCGSSEGL